MLQGRNFMSIRFLLSPWTLSVLLQALLSGVLLAKRMWRKFPVFLGYCISGLVLDVGLYALYASHWRRLFYFKAYWFTEAVGLLMGLAVVYEIFNHLFAPYPGLKKLATQGFQAAVLLLILLGCIVIYAQPMGEKNHVQATFMILQEVTRVLEVGLLGFVFFFAGIFGLHWRQYLFGIALGLGIFTAVDLVGIAMRLQFGVMTNPVLGVIRTISFNSSMVIWVGYLLAPELATSPAEMPKRAQLEQWNNAIMELIYQ